MSSSFQPTVESQRKAVERVETGDLDNCIECENDDNFVRVLLVISRAWMLSVSSER